MKNQTIAEKNINHLYDYIRTKLFIPTTKRNQVFFEYLAARSGHSMEQINTLFNQVDQVHKQNTVSAEQLLKLNQLIEEFKQ